MHQCGLTRMENNILPNSAGFAKILTADSSLQSSVCCAGPSSETLPVFCHGHCSRGKMIFTELRGEPVIWADSIALGSESTHLPLCFKHYIHAIFVEIYVHWLLCSAVSWSSLHTSASEVLLLRWKNCRWVVRLDSQHLKGIWKPKCTPRK